MQVFSLASWVFFSKKEATVPLRQHWREKSSKRTANGSEMKNCRTFYRPSSCSDLPSTPGEGGLVLLSAERGEGKKGGAHSHLAYRARRGGGGGSQSQKPPLDSADEDRRGAVHPGLPDVAEGGRESVCVSEG